MTRRRVALALLALALLLAQALALVHRAAHAAGPAPLAGLALNTADPHGHGDHHEGGWLDELFAHAAGGADCRLIDSLCHDGLPAVVALGLHAAPSPTLLATAQGDFIARWAALFDARGPPPPR